jgi:hypothetical protein
MNTMTRQPEGSPESHSELLLLPDGRILVHNLTQAMAEVLRELNQFENTIRPRAETKSECKNARQTVA